MNEELVNKLRTVNTHDIAKDDYRLLDAAADEIENLSNQLSASRKIIESYRIRLINIANGETHANIPS